LFHQNNNKSRVFFPSVVALVATALVPTATAQKTPPRVASAEKTTPIVGRVLADVGSFVFGSGLGPKWATFIFVAEEGGGTRVAPVKVSYAFFKSDGPLPDNFFDYSKRYELQVVRDRKCDERVESLSNVKNVDESGKPLAPSYVLRFLDGAPKDLLKLDAVLPCYVLRPGRYKVLSTGKKSKSDSSTSGNGSPS
jgi:hypothetical protein